MQKSIYEVTRFDLENGIYVEVTLEGGSYEFFVCKEQHGVKNHVFGLLAEDCGPEEWEDMIESNMDDILRIAEEMI